MKRTISFLLILALLAGIVVMVINAQDEACEALVMYDDNSMQVLTFENKSEMNQAIKELNEQENVIVAQQNYQYSAAAYSTDDAYADKQWALYNDGTFTEQISNYFGRYRTTSAKAGVDINAYEAFEIYDGGREVIVAVVDTAIDRNHEDLAGKIWTNEDEIPNNSKDDDGNGFTDDVYGWNFGNNSNDMSATSDDEHGTHCAGTIIAQANNNKGIAGIAQGDDITVMSVKALGDNGGTTESVVKAIQYAEQNGASICNLSLGTYINDKALYNMMKNSDMLFVVAAGNDGMNLDSRPSYPAAYDLENIITVANINYDGNLAKSSSYGKMSVDIAAPGSAILSTIPGGYSYMTGTSMAAPFVSAACAVVYSHNEDISLSQVKNIILESANTLDSVKNTVKTGGILDMAAALGYEADDVEEETETAGSAPEISAQMSGNYLCVSFRDADGDIVSARYLAGEHDAGDFADKGTEIKTDGSGNAYFTAYPGTYTFYASDEAGNETTKTIKIAAGNMGRQHSRYIRRPVW